MEMNLFFSSSRVSGNLQMRTADVAKLVSRAWKSLASSDRLVFLDLAKRDKERYEVEKANYKGPWKVIDVKDRSAPKRPMSAFLAFSNERRKEVTEANPMLTNGEISKILADMWRVAPAKQKQLYQHQEVKLRQQYKASVSKRRKSLKAGDLLSVLECVSVSSSSLKNFSDSMANHDDSESLGCFEYMLDSLNEEESSEVMSNSSRGHSVSENTARVTLPDEMDNQMMMGSCGVNYMQNDMNNNASSSFSMEPPRFGSAFPLEPLISTDFGGFLAAAAFLDGPSDPFLQ